MKQTSRSTPRPSPTRPPAPEGGSRSWVLWLGLVAGVAVVVLALRPRSVVVSSTGLSRNGGTDGGAVSAGGGAARGAARDRAIGGLRRTGSAGGANVAPEAVVANRVTAYADRRRNIAHELARKTGIEVPADVDRFFDAVQAGNWSDIKGLYNTLSSQRHSPETAKTLEAIWPAVVDAFGAAALTTTWPAEELLAYGESVLGGMAPGTVYITGTEAARYIPSLLSDQGMTAPLVITPDTFADPAQIEYLALLNPERFGSLNREDIDRILKRDQAPADSGSQPGVDPKSARADILRALIEKNPGVPFAVDGSFDLGGLASDIVPTGAVLEIRPGSGGGAGSSLSPARGSETAEFWRATANRLETESTMPGDAPTRREYSQMALIQGQVLADQNLPMEAEQTFRAAVRMAPAAYEPVERLAVLLTQVGRAGEANQVIDAYAQANPGFVSQAEALRKRLNAGTQSPAP